MKMKSLFILLFIMCIGYFIPKEVFAKNISPSYNTNIDYQFFVDEEENDAGNLNFKLYDKTGSLSFNSVYDDVTKRYMFYSFDDNFNIYVYSDSNIYYNKLLYLNDADDFKNYIPHYEELYQVNTFNDLKNYLDKYNFHYKWKKYNSSIDYYGVDDGYAYAINAYNYIPMILEEPDLGFKKIIFASINLRCEHFADPNWGDDTSYWWNYDHYNVGVNLINNTNHWNSPNHFVFGSSFLDNMNFMRKTMLDYSDELWEELNNGPIASSEIYSDNIASTNYKYINQSTIDGTRNVPEETLEDYASSLPVLSFKKVDSTDEDKDNNTKNNIVNVITNPKTWNNGIVILVISIIVIIGSSIVLIKRKSN